MTVSLNLCSSGSNVPDVLEGGLSAQKAEGVKFWEARKITVFLLTRVIDGPGPPGNSMIFCYPPLSLIVVPSLYSVMNLPVDGPPPLHPDHFYSVLVLHTQLDEGHRNQDGSPTQPSHAVNTDARLSGVTILYWEGK